MNERCFSLLILIVICQSVFCRLNSVATSNPVIKDLAPLSKIATTLGDKLSVVGIIHGAAHSAVMAGNFAKEVKFIDTQSLTCTGASDGFIVAYDDGTDKVLAKTVLKDVAITKLSNNGTKYYVVGTALEEGSWCGAEKIAKDDSFSAVFELKNSQFECKSVTKSSCQIVFADEASATLCTTDTTTAIEVTLGATKVSLNYIMPGEGSSITLRHLVQSGPNYFLIGEYKGIGAIKNQRKDETILGLTSDNGLFALFFKNSAAEYGVEIETGDKKFAADFVRVTEQRVIVAATATGSNSEISLPGIARKVSLAGKGVLLFDLIAITPPATPTEVVATWAVAYPLGNVELRDMAVLNKFVFLAHDQPESSLPFEQKRNVAVSVLELDSDKHYTFVHSVSQDDLRAGSMTINEGALLLTALNNDRGSLELMLSETSLPVEMTRPPVVEPPKAVPVAANPLPATPVAPVQAPVKAPPVASAPVAAPVQAAPVAQVAPVVQAVPVDPIAPPKADQAPLAEPIAEVVKDNTATFSSSYVIIAAVILTVFLGYFGLRFWRQYRAERQRNYGRVRMEDRVREDDFYNP